MFDEIGMDSLIEKRNAITSYLEFILHEIDKEVESTFEIITPSKEESFAIICIAAWRDEVCLNT
jgi:kynureninase